MAWCTVIKRLTSQLSVSTVLRVKDWSRYGVSAMLNVWVSEMVFQVEEEGFRTRIA